MADFVAFLQDHAANERKVCHAALTLAAQYPEHPSLVDASIEIAREELDHFERIYRVLRERGHGLGQDLPDPYAGAMRRLERKGRMGAQLMDRLLIFALIEARGYERFALVADALQQRAEVFGAPDDAELAGLYRELAGSEARHRATYLRIARELFAAEQLEPRLDELLVAEAAITAELPLRAALH